MKKQPVHPASAPVPAGAYTPGFIAGGFVFVSGQTAEKPGSAELVEGGIREQTKQVMENIGGILEAAGCSMDDVVKVTQEMPFGGTDCALPMIHATRQGLEVDTFVVYTDNETWAGDVHPHQALRAYREQTGIPAKLVVVGMTATGFSIADPDDAGMLDIAGFDAAVPNLITEFARG